MKLTKRNGQLLYCGDIDRQIFISLFSHLLTNNSIDKVGGIEVLNRYGMVFVHRPFELVAVTGLSLEG